MARDQGLRPKEITMKKLVLLMAAALVAPSLFAAEDGKKLFTEKILPVMQEKCFGCHGATAKKPAAKLLLDTKAGLAKGGKSGTLLVAGKPDDSLIVQVLRYNMEDADMNMPPKKKGGKLDDAIIADFVKWVKLGAPDTRAE